MESPPASGPPERRGEGRRPGGPSAFASVRLPRSRHRSVPAPLRFGPAPFRPRLRKLRRSPLCAEPTLRGAYTARSRTLVAACPARSLAWRRPGWGRKRLPLRGFLKLIARSAASAPHALRPRSVSAPLRSGPVSASSAGALTARSLCCAGAFARRAFAPPLAPNRSLPRSRLPSLRGAVTAVTEGCCQRLRSVCNFLLLLLFRAFFRHAAPPL